MTDFMYTASVPVFKQMLDALAEILAKAETHTSEKKIETSALLDARLFPDMFPLRKQVQIACDFARGISARLAEVELPVYEDNEPMFDELRALIAKSLAFIGGIDATKFDGSARREIVLRPGTPKEKKLSGQAYLLNYGLPQFFFHINAAYMLLRHNGIEIGKRDYMGVY